MNESYELRLRDGVEDAIKEYEQRNGFKLDAQARRTFRFLYMQDSKFYEREPFKEDNHNTRDY